MSLTSSPPKTYVVVARSASGAYFAPDEALVFDRVQTQHGLARVVFSTRRAPLPGFTKAVPRGLAVDIRGPAPSVDAAIDPFVQAANFFCPIISLSCNAPIEDLQPELAFDVTSGAKHRPYFQQFLLDERIMPIRRRRVPVDLTFALAAAVAKHSGSDRLHRAAVHYYQALQFWRPGYETFALAHLYMGVETLTPIVRDAYLASNGLSVDDLRKRWAIPESDRVEPDVRRRLIFDNDATTYSEAKGASDGLEHGFMGFPDIHAKAVAVNRKTAGYLRRAILEHVGLPPGQLKVLLGAPYEEPFYLHYTKYIWGELIGEGDRLGASDQEYPILQWRSTIRELPTAPDETPRIQLVESYTPRLADGIGFVPSRIEIRAPAGTSTPESDVIAPKIEHHQSGKPALGLAGVEWNRPEMQPFADAMARFLLNFGTIDFYSRLWLNALTEGEEAGDDLSFDSRLERLLERVRNTEALEPLRNRIEEAWLPTRRLAAMQDSIARSPLLFGWKGPEGDREPDFAVMRRRGSPHWPDTPEPVILLAELSQATEEAGAIATRIISLSAELQEILAAVTSTEEEPEPGQAVEAEP
jgi:hypothetical protein